MKHDLSHVYWIGGSGCSGKSTIAKILAKDYGFNAYHCDDQWGEHEARSTPAEHPATLRVRGNMVEYLQLAPVEFEEASRAWFKEDFAMVLEDLDGMPKDTIVVDGVTLEPEFVLEVAEPRRAIFIIASEIPEGKLPQTRHAKQVLSELARP